MAQDIGPLQEYLVGLNDQYNEIVSSLRIRGMPSHERDKTGNIVNTKDLESITESLGKLLAKDSRLAGRKYNPASEILFAAQKLGYAALKMFNSSGKIPEKGMKDMFFRPDADEPQGWDTYLRKVKSKVIKYAVGLNLGYQH